MSSNTFLHTIKKKETWGYVLALRATLAIARGTKGYGDNRSTGVSLDTSLTSGFVPYTPACFGILWGTM